MCSYFRTDESEHGVTELGRHVVMSKHCCNFYSYVKENTTPNESNQSKLALVLEKRNTSCKEQREH